MKLFYRASLKEMVDSRNKIFVENCMPILFEKGFVQSPFSTSHFGRDMRDFTYDFIRINNSLLETMQVQIVRGDKWIKIFLNIFDVQPKLTSTKEAEKKLKEKDGMQFVLPPNSLTTMQLISDSFDGMPLLNYRWMFKDHSLKSYFTEKGFHRRMQQFSRLIEGDLKNLDWFISFWHKKYKPFVTNHEGKFIGLENMTLQERLSYTGLTKEFEQSLKKNKKRAKYILEWLQVDETSHKNIIKKRN